jgi:hypothetical protein
MSTPASYGAAVHSARSARAKVNQSDPAAASRPESTYLAMDAALVHRGAILARVLALGAGYRAAFLVAYHYPELPDELPLSRRTVARHCQTFR